MRYGAGSAAGATVGVGAFVVLAVGALGGASAAHGRLHTVGESAGGEEEAGVSDHPVVGADGQASMCQLRIIDSQAVGSLKQPISRMDSTVRASWVVVAT